MIGDPPNVSRMPASPIRDISTTDMRGMLLGGRPNSFCVPAIRKSNPAMMRRTLNMRLVEGEREVRPDRLTLTE